METKKIITYGDNEFNYYYDNIDKSGIGCIIEIVDRDEYGLTRFKNLKGKNIIDIGANHGLVTIILAKQNPESTIYSFEPNPHVFKWLERNVKENNLTNVKYYNRAIHSSETLKIVSHPNCSGLSIMDDSGDKLDEFYNHKHRNVYGYAKIEEFEVPTFSMDTILTDENIDDIHLMKIDCEGSEYDILTTSDLLFNKVNIENMIGEFHNLQYNNYKMEASDLLKLCKDKINGVVELTILNL